MDETNVKRTNDWVQGGGGKKEQTSCVHYYNNIFTRLLLFTANYTEKRLTPKK